MSGILKEKKGLVRDRLSDVNLKPGDHMEVDLNTAHVVINVFPLTVKGGGYRERMERAIALAEKNAEIIKRGTKGKTEAVKAIHATREERGEAIQK